MLSIEHLKEEHQLIKTAMQISTYIISSKRKIKKQELKTIIIFFIQFVNTLHHKKEEDIFFKEMENFGVKNHNGPLEIIIKEHRTKEKLINSSLNFLKKGKIKHSIEKLKIYLKILKFNMEREDDVIFTLAQTYIPYEVDELILNKMKRFEKNIIAKKEKEELIKSILTLKPSIKTIRR